MTNGNENNRLDKIEAILERIASRDEENQPTILKRLMAIENKVDSPIKDNQ